MEESVFSIPGPHFGQPVFFRGETFAKAHGAIIAVHGRDMQADDMLKIVGKMDTAGWVVLAPQANGTGWCPERFYAPIQQNEPWLSSALAALGWCIRRCVASGFGPEKQVLLGFSQGACLVLEFAARNPARYGAVVGLAGALFGPLGTARGNSEGLQGTPVLMGCGENDPLIPRSYLLESAKTLRKMGAMVDLRMYSNSGHRVTLDEIHAVNAMLAKIPG